MKTAMQELIDICKQKGSVDMHDILKVNKKNEQEIYDAYNAGYNDNIGLDAKQYVLKTYSQHKNPTP